MQKSLAYIKELERQAVRPMHKPMPLQTRAFLYNLLTMTKGNPREAVQLMVPQVSVEEADKIATRFMKSKDVRQVLKTYAARAVDRVELLAEGARSEKVRLDANIAILDRAGFAVPKEQHTSNTLVIQIPEAIARKNGIAATGERSSPI
ncbi:MAG: hypothetical protein ACYDAK_13270 [Candidatus Limnocylindrales bacterium]